MRLLRPLLLTVVTALVATVLVLGEPPTTELHAAFDDVADLAVGAPVHVADVEVGRVTAIELVLSGQGAHALVTMAVDADVSVPADAVARLRRTSALGEKFIELDGDRSSTAALADGATIERTEVVSDVEELLGSGTEVFAAVAASELQALLDNGADTFGGRGPQMRANLDGLATLARTYAGRTDELTTLIVEMDDLAASLAPNADEHGRAIVSFAETMRVLSENRDELVAALDALNALSRSGVDLLASRQGEIDAYLGDVRRLLEILALEQDELRELLTYTPGHNDTLEQVTAAGMLQLLIDISICGFPGGGEVPDDPGHTCDNRFVPEEDLRYDEDRR